MGTANKTQPAVVDMAAWLAGVEPAQRRAEAEAVAAMMARVSSAPPVLWGGNIIGFGQYHYRYDSGREGDAPRIAFSPRKAALVLYVLDGFPGHADLLARLGKHTTGVACLYLKRLADADPAVLEELVASSWGVMAERYPPD